MSEVSASYSAELQLLLALLRSESAPGGSDDVDRCLHLTLDWPKFLTLVDRHRVAPLVWRGMQALPEGRIEAGVLRALHQRVEANTGKALLQAREMRRLGRSLDDQGVAWLVFKGPVLAMQAYGDLSLRHAGDLDMLIAAEDVAVAEPLVEALGYQRVQPGFALSPRQWRAYRQHFADFGYLHQLHAFNIELHWRWFSNHHLLPLDQAQVRSDAGTETVAGIDVASMAWSDLMLYLCAHGANHGWFRLFWLVDVDRLMQGCSKQQQQALLIRATDLGVERILLQALLLAHRLLATPLTPAVLRAAERDSAVAALVAMALEALRGPAAYWSEEAGRSLPQAWRMLVYALRLRGGLGYRWRELTNKLINPPDWRRLRLPDGLFFLYLPLRPMLRLLRGKAGY